MKEKLAKLALPGTWALIAVVMGAFGVPPQVTAAVHVIVQVAPDVINAAGVIASTAVSAFTAWRAMRKPPIQ